MCWCRPTEGQKQSRILDFKKSLREEVAIVLVLWIHEISSYIFLVNSRIVVAHRYVVE